MISNLEVGHFYRYIWEEFIGFRRGIIFQVYDNYDEFYVQVKIIFAVNCRYYAAGKQILLPIMCHELVDIIEVNPKNIVLEALNLEMQL